MPPRENPSGLLALAALQLPVGKVQPVRHAGQIGQRGRLHLAYDVAAMDFDGDLADAHVGGNLLVEATGHDMRHDLALALAQTLEPHPQSCDRLLVFEQGAVARQTLLDRVQDFLIAERLRQELDRAALHRLNRHRHVGVARDENNRYANVRFDQLALQFEAAAPGQSDVENEASGSGRPAVLQEFGDRTHRADLQPHRAKQAHERLPNSGVVIDDDNRRLLVHFACGDLDQEDPLGCAGILKAPPRRRKRLFNPRVRRRCSRTAIWRSAAVRRSYNRQEDRTRKYFGHTSLPREHLDRVALKAPGGRVAISRPVISIVDDDESIREAAKGLMKSLGYNAVAFPSAEDFLDSRQLPQTACLIADINTPGMSGLDLHRRLSGSGRRIPTILITAYPDDRVRDRALHDGVLCYLIKPFEENELLTCIETALSPDIR